MTDPTASDEPREAEPRVYAQVFAAPPDDPRARRAADVVELVVALVVLLLAAWAHRAGTDVDERVAVFFSGDLPGWLSATLTVVYIAGGLYAVGLLIGIAAFGKGRLALARDMVIAGLLALAASAGAAQLAGPEWPDIVPELLERDGAPSYPVVRLSIVMAVLAVASPYLAVPMRRVGRQLLVAMAAAALVLSYGTVSAIVGAVALGAAAAATVHLIFGSGVGIPSKARIIDALASLGVTTQRLDYRDDAPMGAAILHGEADGAGLVVKVYGRDAADAAVASRLWRRAWYRDDDRPLTASGTQQAEHEALMLLEGERFDLPVPDVVAWGRGSAGDALVVTAAPEGRTLASLDADAVDESVLARCWDGLLRFHAAGIALHGIDRDQLVIDADRVVFADVAAARRTPDPQRRAADVAQLLVATSLATDVDRAVDAARSAIGDERLAAALPLLQGAALPRSLQAEVRREKLKLKDLRQATARAIDTDEPDLAQLERVSWRDIGMLVLTLAAAYALITSLADVGFDTLSEQLGDAEWAWIVTAFVLAQLTNFGEWITLTGLVPGRVPLGPTLQFRYALNFVGLAVPGDAGSMAMNIRYMEKLGVPPAAAVAQGPLVTVFTKVTDIALLLIASRVIGQTVDLDDVDSGPVLRLIAVAVVAIVIGVIVAFAVPKFRNRILPHLREAFGAVRESVTDPERLLRVAGGTLIQRLLFAMALAAAVGAFGESISFSEAVFVNSAVSLFVGLVPVPGGVGVGEAAITAGLAAVGVPEGPAVAAAIIHRMSTNYLPPVYGWYSSRWLTERDYL